MESFLYLHSFRPVFEPINFNASLIFDSWHANTKTAFPVGTIGKNSQQPHTPIRHTVRAHCGQRRAANASDIDIGQSPRNVEEFSKKSTRGFHKLDQTCGMFRISGARRVAKHVRPGSPHINTMLFNQTFTILIGIYRRQLQIFLSLPGTSLG